MKKYQKIAAYIQYLTEELGYQVAIKDFVGFLGKDQAVFEALGPYAIHRAPFCMEIKSNRKLWDACQNSSFRLKRRCQASAQSFAGICYCGYGEWVIPVRVGNDVIGSVEIAGFEHDPETSRLKLLKVAKGSFLEINRLEKAYRESITLSAFDPVMMDIHGGVVADFLSMYYKALLAEGCIEPNVVYSHDASKAYLLSNAIAYIKAHFAEDISVADIAAFCQCSVSGISHLFTKNMHQNIRTYINRLRIEEAKRLIETQKHNFTEIAYQCGYSDPNYFSNVFRKTVGLTPSEYRAQSKRKVLLP